MYKWLDYVDLEIGRSEGVFDELSVEEKRVVYEDIVADLESHKMEYEKVVDAGNSLLDELRQSNESFDEEQTKINDVTNCWQATNNRLQEIKERIDFLLELKQCRAELANLNIMLDGYTKWYETNQANNQIEPLGVSITRKTHANNPFFDFFCLPKYHLFIVHRRIFVSWSISINNNDH